MLGSTAFGKVLQVLLLFNLESFPYLFWCFDSAANLNIYRALWLLRIFNNKLFHYQESGKQGRDKPV